MNDYCKPDASPLLQELEIEILNLEDSYKLFLSICENIEREISKFKSLQDKEKIQKVNIKLQNLNEVMDNFYDKSGSIKNYMNFDNQKFTFKLQSLIFCVWSKFEELNGKLTDIINDAKRRIDNQVNINTCMYLEQEIEGKESNDENANYTIGNADISLYNHLRNKSTFDSDKIVTERIKLDINRLKEKKEELQKIVKITKQISDLTNELKSSFIQHSGKVPYHQDQLNDTKLSVKNGEELKTTKSGTLNKCYFWTCTLISSIFVTGVVYLYLKL